MQWDSKSALTDIEAIKMLIRRIAASVTVNIHVFGARSAFVSPN
jgi:hypothetical protein